MVEMSPLDKASLFMCCALLLTFTKAEREYFVLPKLLTWDEARNYCQLCFKDLVTLTPENSQIIVQRLDTAHWIGLRKHFPSNITDNNVTNINDNLFKTSNNLIKPADSLTNNNSSLTNCNSLSSSSTSLTKTSNSLIQTDNSIFSIISNNSDISNSNITSNSSETLYDAWSRWANWDPVLYQNWYPGMPKFQSPIPNINCCSCSCTCPAKPTSIMTSFGPFTDLTTTTTSRFGTTGKTTTEIQLSTTTTGHPLSTATPTTVTTTAGNTTNMESFLHTTDQNTVNTTQESTTNIHNFLSATTTTTSTRSTTKSFLNPPDQSTVNTTPSTITNTHNLIKSTNQSEFNTTKDNTTKMEGPSITTTDKTTDSPTTVKTTSQRGPTETSTISTTTFDVHKSSTGSQWTTTQPSIESTCEQSTMDIPVLAEINENYIEDSCVVILRFGLWIERRCSEILPFICYEDRFFGQVNVTNITSGNATLTWLPGPGDISHYDVEVTGDIELHKNINKKYFTLDLFNLMAGGYYKVQVFPFKCGRSLNPQNASFYTIPYEVIDLRVENITEKSVFLKWSKQDGKADFYLVETENLKKQVNTTDLRFDGLTPGNCYTFTVKSGVPTQWSKEANISNCTKPGKVSNLKLTNIEDTSFTVSWENPEGKFTGFNVTVKFNEKEQTHSVNETKLTLTDLQEGTTTTVQVVVLSIHRNHSLMGDVTEITTNTVPGRVKDLELTAEQSAITATWNYAVIGNDSEFIAKLYLSNTEIEKTSLHNTTAKFFKLKTATNYTVEVSVVKGKVSSPKETRSIFTLPTAPTDLIATDITKNTIELTWDVTEEMKSATFVFYVSSYWNKSYTERVEKRTSHTFKNLVSGTKYHFTVHAEVGNVTSGSANCSIQTKAEEIDITLLTLCSSTQPLYCANNPQNTSVIKQIKSILDDRYEDEIFWTEPVEMISPNV